MNRINISPLASTVFRQEKRISATTHSLDHFDELIKRSDDEISVFVPMHYEKNYSYPLIVWLHSDGEGSAEVQRIMPKASTRNFVGVAPQSTVGNF